MKRQVGSNEFQSGRVAFHLCFRQFVAVKPNKVSPGKPNLLFMDASLTIPRGLIEEETDFCE